jgi:hypothetical protein
VQMLGGAEGLLHRVAERAVEDESKISMPVSCFTLAFRRAP